MNLSLCKAFQLKYWHFRRQTALIAASEKYHHEVTRFLLTVSGVYFSNLTKIGKDEYVNFLFFCFVMSCQGQEQ